MFEIREDDLSGQATRALLELHLTTIHADSPEGHSFALDLSGLSAANVTVWSAWDGTAVVGMAALKELDPDAGEVKSMRTDPAHLNRGVASELLEHIIAEARRRGYRRLSLETGTGPAFEAAIALYSKRGFQSGDAFAGYRASDFNQFFHLSL